MATQTDPSSRAKTAGADDAAGGDPRAAAQRAADQAQERVQDAAGRVQDKVREQVDQRSSQLAEHAHQQASDLRSVSAALRDEGKERPAQAVDRVAGYAEQAGTYLRDIDADGLLSDAEDLGRRRPGAVAGGALLIGLVASRFLKASSTRRHSLSPGARSADPAAGAAASDELGALPRGGSEPAPRARS